MAGIVAVLGLSASSRADLLDEISRLCTSLLAVTNGQNFSGATAELTTAARGIIGRIGPVTQVQYFGTVSAARAFRSPFIPTVETNGLSVDASRLNLPWVIGTVSGG